jgi:hypothetical protein
MALWGVKVVGILFGGITNEDTSEEGLERVYSGMTCLYFPLLLDG